MWPQLVSATLRQNAVAFGAAWCMPERLSISDAEGHGAKRTHAAAPDACMQEFPVHQCCLAESPQEEDIWMRVELHDASLVPAHLRPQPPAEKQPLGDSLRKALRSLSSSSGGKPRVASPRRRHRVSTHHLRMPPTSYARVPHSCTRLPSTHLCTDGTTAANIAYCEAAAAPYGLCTASASERSAS